MYFPRSEYLIGKLLSNKLSKDELEEMLSGLGEDEMSSEYSALLASYFETLIAQNIHSK